MAYLLNRVGALLIFYPRCNLSAARFPNRRPTQLTCLNSKSPSNAQCNISTHLLLTTKLISHAWYKPGMTARLVAVNRLFGLDASKRFDSPAFLSTLLERTLWSRFMPLLTYSVGGLRTYHPINRGCRWCPSKDTLQWKFQTAGLAIVLEVLL